MSGQCVKIHEIRTKQKPVSRCDAPRDEGYSLTSLHMLQSPWVHMVCIYQYRKSREINMGNHHTSIKASGHNIPAKPFVQSSAWNKMDKYVALFY